ncbi:MAG TPA: N-6 DNA methylase, partial [Thermoanaerobaculia bacterium]
MGQPESPASLESIAYLEAVPLAERRKEGLVYTPRRLVDFILDLALDVTTQPIESTRILDPASGSGAFLEQITFRLARRLVEKGVDFSVPAGSGALLGTIEACVFGCDKDPNACAIARRSIRDLAGRLLGSPIPPKFFDSNVQVKDYLGVDKLHFNGDSRFDLIVGNPPYVTTSRLSTAHKNELRDLFSSANGRVDLYALFFERSLQLLAPGGRLALITPNKFLTSESARPLRRLILQMSCVNVIAIFRSHRVFGGAATVPCVTVLERGGNAQAINLLECDVSQGKGIVVVSKSQVDCPRQDGEPWFLADPRLLEVAQLIRGTHAHLRALTRRISSGMATGRDGLFVAPCSPGLDVEPELKRPAVRGQDILPFQICDPKLEILIPYVHGANNKPTLIDMNDFPKAVAYLETFRGELEARHCVREWKKTWYDLHDPWLEDITSVPKILVPDIARSNRFALDTGYFCPLDSAYYIIPVGVHPEYLVAVLNSKP